MMTKRVVTIPDDLGIQQISNILVQNSLSGVPVMDNEHKLIGFVSERDIVAAVTSGGFLEKKAKDIMCKDITTVSEDTTLEQVTKIFAEKPFRHLPVVNKGEVIGIISRRDVFGKLLES
jgi:CBS domain-containing protein